MARVLLFLIIGFLVVAVFRGFFRPRIRSEPPAKSVSGEDMVACARCGVNQPRSEAVFESGTYHCKDNPRCHA